MIGGLFKANKLRLIFAYTLTIAGYLAAQIYPLFTGYAINGVVSKNYYPVLFLCIVHFIMVSLEVAAKMVDTRVFATIHATFASDMVALGRDKRLDPPLIAGRSILLREYITFLERDVPAALLSIISFGVASTALFLLDPVIGFACLLLLVPSYLINRRLAEKSKKLNEGLHDRLEREISLLQSSGGAGIRRHYKAAALWRIKLSDLEATSYGLLELFVITLFAVAFWRVATQAMVEPGTIYIIFTYVWRYVVCLDQVPQIVQQIDKLRDISRRLQV